MRLVWLTNGTNDFEGLVADDVDLDSRFLLTDPDDGSKYWINGWLIEDIVWED